MDNLTMKVFLKIIKKKGLVLKSILMVLFTKEILLMAKNVGMVNILSLMENIMKEIFKMIYMKGRELMNGHKKGEVIKGNFIWEIWKEMELPNIVIALS